MLHVAAGISTVHAGTATNTNACRVTALSTYFEIPVTMSGTDSPDPVTLGGTLAVSSLNINAAIPGDPFVAGYRLFLLTAGTNTVSATIAATVAGSNTAQGTRTPSITTSLTVTIVDPTPSNRSSGDESALPVTINKSLGSTSWTQAGGCPIVFTQGTFTVDALIGEALPVSWDCSPSSGLTGCDATGANCTGFTPNPNPNPFETTTVSGCTAGTTTTSSTTTTTLFTSDLDHFKCYKAKDLRNPRFAPRDDVALDDHFGNDVVEVRKPMMICPPASKNGSGVGDPDTHLCCYRIRGTRLDPAVGIGITDEFGSLELGVSAPKMLCQPCVETSLP